MSNVKKAQKIVNDVDKELGIALVAYQLSELEYLKAKIEEIIDLGVDMDELHDADDDDLLDDEDFDESDEVDEL